MLRRIWLLVKESVLAYIDDGALSRGAAIAYYTVTSLAPVLLIVIVIAGSVFGEAAARGAIQDQISGLMGQQSADILQTAIRSASGGTGSAIAAIIGIVTLLVTASGVFGEMQTALNAIWNAQLVGTTISRLVRARIVSLGLVGALGFLLLASLVISAALSALSNMLNEILPFASFVLQVVNFLVSFILISLLFAAIYKVLPDRKLKWKDVFVGAVVTSLLFTVGKSLIGLYLGSSSMASSYGAAGGLIILLVWVYYSAQIFLLGAEFTKAYASNYGSLRNTNVAGRVESGEPVPEDKNSTLQTGHNQFEGRQKCISADVTPPSYPQPRTSIAQEIQSGLIVGMVRQRPLGSILLLVGLGALMGLRGTARR